MVSIKVVHITDSMDMSLSKLPEIVEHRGVWQASVHGVAKSGTWPHDWPPLPLKPALLYSVKLGPGAVQISSLFWLLSVRLNQQGELDRVCERRTTKELAASYVSWQKQFILTVVAGFDISG